jgi:hypothetical protein
MAQGGNFRLEEGFGTHANPLNLGGRREHPQRGERDYGRNRRAGRRAGISHQKWTWVN